MNPLSRFRDAVWKWPDGLLWKLSAPLVVGSRSQKFEIFSREIGLDPANFILDVGGGAHEVRGGNYFESHYPHPERIVVCVYGAGSELDGFRKQYPLIHVVVGDGRELPFADDSFDVVVSNAVIEHVGLEDQQRAFVSELTRVAKCVFLATPNAWFPVDTHSLIPIAHYFPPRMRFAIYRALGRGFWASLDRLNLVTARQLRSFVPAAVDCQFIRLRLLGLTHSFVMILRRS
jgi:hypothetical protein